ncbi:MAG TPA: phosphotransferase [Kiritimatiellia bacterium]|nr:phosphotransferase [Kiritimatiellia bacterium]HOR98261.1 phosphotransferase [Kiritimatiellia bacterium]HPC48611.1 phosphotransferase [Kiritimatiellia bacterium]HPK37228.1 phosphotransferase [Kiritimatiellia bacterium]HRU19539.1 phosphotransferase [Kiritimatiellia bacterium]
MTALPKRALVLAAGLGTRLRPLTQVWPKPLVPLWDVPLLEHVLRLLESWGVEEVAVNLHWRPEAIRAYLETRRGGVRVTFSQEAELLGTGGALRPLRRFFGDGPFWVVNADIAAAVDPQPFCEAFGGGHGLAAAWLEPKKGPRSVETDRRGRITCFRSPTPGVPGTFTFCGLQLVSPRLYDFLPGRPFSTLVDAYTAAMAEGLFVDGVTVPGSYWDDAGTVEALLRIHGEVKRLARRGKPGGALYRPEADRCDANATRFFCVGRDARVGRAVRGSDSVVCGTARVGDASVLRRAVVAGGRVTGRLEDTVYVPLGGLDEASANRAVGALGWPVEETAVSCLGERGSNRSFWRLCRDARRAMLIRYSAERPENLRYAGHARLLADAGIPVPAVLADLPECGMLVLEDWGDDSLQRRMERRPGCAETWYAPVVKTLALWHRDVTRQVRECGAELEPAFDAELYAWERNLFETCLLVSRYGFDAIPAEAERELRGVADRLGRAPQVVVHRDFQSSNILFRGKRFAFIDFQGMRRGAAAYDLASLLYDPYVILSVYVRNQMVAVYGKAYPEHPEAVELFHDGAVQRLIQALGAFGRLASVGQRQFTRHIPRALESLLEAADLCGLDAVGGLAEELIARERYRCRESG